MNYRGKILLGAIGIIICVIIGIVRLNGYGEENEQGESDISSENLAVSTLERFPVEDNDPVESKEPEMEPVSVEPVPIMVHVCGSVVNPGVYTLKETDRVIDAVDMAGGFVEDAAEDYLNLAGVVVDGCRVYVPSKEEVEKADALGDSANLTDVFGVSDMSDMAGITGNEESNSKVNLNSASKEQLMTLPGVGESKAEKIISYREQTGKFNKPEDIMNISGIKEAMYNKIKDLICV